MSRPGSYLAFPLLHQGRKLLKGREILHIVSAVSAPISSPDESLEISYMNFRRSGFDSTLIIILAAFLGSLLCALVVSAMVRCAVRCSGQIESDLTGDVAVVVDDGNCSGMKKSDMKALPTAVYSGKSSKPRGTDCPICLGDFVEGEKLRVLPECNHSFHLECIDKWLVCNPSCPSCRQCLVRPS